MNKLSAGLFLLLGLASPALAQNTTNPAVIANSAPYNASPPTCTSGQFCFLQTDINGNLKTVPASASTPTTIQGAVNVTPTDCSGAITVGGTAQNAFAANPALHGFTIANIDTSEVLWISFTTTAAASGTGSYPLAPATATTFAGLSSYSSPLGFGMNTALSVIAATSTHKFTCTRW